MEAEKAVAKLNLEGAQEESKRLIKKAEEEGERVVSKLMEEIERCKEREEELIKSSIAMQKKLTEALARLNRDASDSIDRDCIKNVIVDWYSKSIRGKEKEQRMVFEIIMSMLNFNDEEKAIVEEVDRRNSIIGGGKIKNFIAPPINPDGTQLELTGDNARELFVDFLIKETNEI